MTSPALVSVVLSITGFFLFSVGDAARKMILRDYDVLTTQFWVALAAAVGILFLAPKIGRLRSLAHPKKPAIQIAKAVLTTALSLTVIVALKFLDMTTFYTIVLLAPLTTTLLARLFFHEPVGLFRGLVIATGFAGVLLVLRPGMQDFNPGIVFAFVGMILFSGNNLLSKLIPASDPKLPLGFYPYVLTALVCLMLSAGRPAIPVTGDAWLFILAGICSVTGLILLIRAFQATAAGIPAAFHYTQLLWGAILGFALFGDIPDFWTVCGGTVIAGSGLALSYSEWKKSPAPVNLQGG